MAERKRYTAEEKAAIVLEVIQDGKKISEVAEKHQIHPNQIRSGKSRRLKAWLSSSERRERTSR